VPAHHLLAQIAADGSLKIPIRVDAAELEALAAGPTREAVPRVLSWSRLDDLEPLAQVDDARRPITSDGWRGAWTRPA
jgi:hypothetical protein